MLLEKGSVNLGGLSTAGGMRRVEKVILGKASKPAVGRVVLWSFEYLFGAAFYASFFCRVKLINKPAAISPSPALSEHSSSP